MLNTLDHLGSAAIWRPVVVSPSGSRVLSLGDAKGHTRPSARAGAARRDVVRDGVHRCRASRAGGVSSLALREGAHRRARRPGEAVGTRLVDSPHPLFSGPSRATARHLLRGGGVRVVVLARRALSFRRLCAADHLDSIDDDCLFCSVDADDGFTREPVSMGGAVALVAGTTVGAGMLALPAVCQDSGFVPSTVALVGCWLYMVTTGILVLEVNLNTMRAAGSDAVLRLVHGEPHPRPPRRQLACTAYVFIHYALLVAYVSRAGEILSDALGGVVPSSAASVAYAAALGGFMFFADASRLESVNSALVVVVLSTFAPLLAIAAGGVDIDNLRVGDWSALPRTIPVVALAFVYHNVVPTVASMMEGDGRRARTAIVAGTAIPFAMFVLWDTALLGNVSAEDAAAALDAVARSGGAVEAFSDPLAALRSTSETANALVEAFSSSPSPRRS